LLQDAMFIMGHLRDDLYKTVSSSLIAEVIPTVHTEVNLYCYPLTV